MHRSQKISNKICDRKWKERQYRIHKQKLRNMKASIDNKPPKQYKHLEKNWKKIQMEEGSKKPKQKVFLQRINQSVLTKIIIFFLSPLTL